MAIAAPSPARFNREAYGYTSALSPRQESRRYSVIVLQAWDTRWARILRRYNPRLKILMYEYVTFANASDRWGMVHCTSLRSDLANPGWFLKGFVNGAARDLISGNSNYVMDVGNPGYERACVGHSVGLAKRLHFDGVYFDGLSAKLEWVFPSGVVPQAVSYRSDSTWQAATYSLLRHAGPAAHRARLLLFGNIGGADQRVWRWWNGPMDGAEEEAWTDAGLGNRQWLWWWPIQLANVAWSEAHGKYVLLHSHNLTEEGNTYGLATMLLVAGGHTSYSTSNANYHTDERWYPEYATATRLGAAEGRWFRRRGGVYERAFAHGIVLVNPSEGTVRRLRLGGRYSGSGLTGAGAVTLGPVSGLVLRRIG